MESTTAVPAEIFGSRRAIGLAALLQILVVSLFMVILYADIVPDLALEWWNQPASSYGMLIPPITLYTVYLGRHRTWSTPAEPSLLGLWLVALGCMVLLLGGLAGEFFLARLSLVILLAGLAWTFWGFQRFQTLVFPFVLLATMVPLPGIVYNTVSAPLQLFASWMATDLAQLLGVSIFREGNIIHLANVSLGVAEACSGLQSLSAMVVASLLLGFLEQGARLERVLLAIIPVPLAIAVNVLRVTGTAVIADYRTEFAMGFYHSFSGWLIFLVGFASLWSVSKLLFRSTRRVP